MRKRHEALLVRNHASEAIRHQFCSMTGGIFITGTDTAVGKTIVTAALAIALRNGGTSVGVMKPVETGVRRKARSDASRLKRAALVQDDLALICPYVFRQPVAPLDASRLTKTLIKVAGIKRAYDILRSQHELLLIEGVGGLHVPLTRTVDVLELIVRLNAPVVVVGRTSLGGVNHALLTLNALRRRNIPIVALVLNRTSGLRTVAARVQDGSTLRLLRQGAGVPVIGPLRYRDALRRSAHNEIGRLAKTAAITELMTLVLAFGRGTLSQHG